jgi:hypothetical protein
MADEVGEHPIFRAWARQSGAWGPDGTWSASFGGDVLSTITSGLDEYLALQRYWREAPAILGCAPWLTDEQLVDRLLRFGSSCIVINKPDLGTGQHAQVRRLYDEGHGFPAEALPAFHSLAPSQGGKPAVLGPYSENPARQGFKSVRVAGISKSQPSAVPLVHAKLLLLGEAREGEGDFGEQVLYFAPRKAWLGSANFTFNSRRSLEFGLWTSDPSILEMVHRFLTDLLSYSELLDSFDVHPMPERIPVEYDDEAMREVLREMGPGPDDREWE